MGARSGLQELTLCTVMGAGSSLGEPSQMVTGLVSLMQRQQQGHLRKRWGPSGLEEPTLCTVMGAKVAWEIRHKR